MGGPLSTDSLETKLINGLQGDFDIHGGDKTTVRLDWYWDFKHDVRELASNKDYPSLTETQMIIVSESVSSAKNFMSRYDINHMKYINRLVKVFEEGSDEKLRAHRIRTSSGETLGNLELGYSRSNEEYHFSMLKKTGRNLSTSVNDYGMEGRERVILGSSMVVDNNTHMFSRGTVEEAERVINNAEAQIDDILDDAFGYCESMGELVRKGIEEGIVYEDYFKEIVDDVEENNNHAYEGIMEGFKD